MVAAVLTERDVAVTRAMDQERIGTMTRAPSRPGRPRAIASADSEIPARDQILNAAAALFVEQGFARTSTRSIAEAAGIRQASLYYHFSGKGEILAELLESSVRPSRELAARLEGAAHDATSAAGALYALALADARLLALAPHNIGMLYLLPELRDPRYDTFRFEREQLERTYSSLASRIHAEPADQGLLGALLIHAVEVVIPLRQEGRPVDVELIAAAVLRIAGLEDSRAAAAAAQGFLQH